jgi:protein MpaA
MKTLEIEFRRASHTHEKRSIEQALSPAVVMARQSSSLLWKPCGNFEVQRESYSLPRFLFIGPKGGGDPIRVALFASLHGDQPETTHALVSFLKLLEENAELARDYFLFVYPVCNPTGFEDNTRCSRRGRDLNREFWNNSVEPEIALLQSEICSHALHGIISLHADDQSTGNYGLSRSGMFAKHLLEPALAAAEAVLPRDGNSTIDGFLAHNAVVRGGYAGAISGPPKIRPRPFELALCTPKSAPQYLQERAFITALQSILSEYRQMIAFAQNL